MCATIGLIWPCIWCKTVPENYEMVVMEFGKYKGRIKGSGIQYCNPILDCVHVSTKNQILNIPTSKVVDVRGNPVDVSGVINFRILNTKKAILDVENYSSFVNNQALAVLKTVCSKYPYESNSDEHEDVSLRGETEQVRQEMKSVL